MNSMLYNLAKTILDVTDEFDKRVGMRDLTAAESEIVQKNIEKRSKPLGINFWDLVDEEDKDYYFVVHDIEADKVYTATLQDNCKDYWEALRKGLYYCSRGKNLVLKKVGYNPRSERSVANG